MEVHTNTHSERNVHTQQEKCTHTTGKNTHTHGKTNALTMEQIHMYNGTNTHKHNGTNAHTLQK